MVLMITEWATRVMLAMGYAGLALLMALESMIAPIPSEAVMPFAGFLIADGQFTWTGSIVASSLGTLAGSWASYLMGRWGGYPLVVRYGRYLLLDREHLEFTIRWFQKRGPLTIFVARFVPVVRHFISIPAGVAGMNPVTFTVYTLVGGTLWNGILLVLGYLLRERWELVGHYSHPIDYAVAAGLLGVGGWWIWQHFRRRRRSREAA